MYYWICITEMSHDTCKLEVCTDLWDVFETVYSIPFEDVKRVEMELMCKWKDEMEGWGFSPAPAYKMEMGD